MDDPIVIREAVREDVRAIAEIIVEDWQKAYKGIIDQEYLDSLDIEDRYQREIGRYQVYHVATVGHQVAGCSWLQSAESEEADCEIVALYVRYGMRGNGVGRQLLLEAKDHFAQAGKRKMIIWCLKENREARTFYERMGGKECSGSTHRWGNREYDMVSYTYDLS